MSATAPARLDASSSGALPPRGDGARFGRRFVDSRTAEVAAEPGTAFEPIRRIGGGAGWYYADWLWWLRGAMDRLMGGVGLRRGSVRPDTLRVGDVVDCWRVEAFEPDRLLLLAAEMKLPGRGWLRFEVHGNGNGSVIRQTAVFDAAGILGLAYWYLTWPVHVVIFAGMLRGLTKAVPASDK